MAARESIAGAARDVARAVRMLAGAPDYQRYAEHMRARHPDEVPLSHDEFVRTRQEERYSRPGSRCC